MFHHHHWDTGLQYSTPFPCMESEYSISSLLNILNLKHQGHLQWLHHSSFFPAGKIARIETKIQRKIISFWGKARFYCYLALQVHFKKCSILHLVNQHFLAALAALGPPWFVSHSWCWTGRGYGVVKVRHIRVICGPDWKWLWMCKGYCFKQKPTKPFFVLFGQFCSSCDVFHRPKLFHTKSLFERGMCGFWRSKCVLNLK